MGRTKPFAVQSDDGGYRINRTELQDYEIIRHLRGEITLGTYTINADNKVRCITWDIDSGNYSDVMRLKATVPGPLAVFHSGRKGYHVIQSYDPPIPADLAHAYGNQVKEAAGLGDIESFPKQPVLEENKVGSLTKLPMGVHQVTGNRAYLMEGSIQYANWPTLHRPIAAPARVRTEGEGWLAQLFGGKPIEGRNNSLHRFASWMRYKDYPEELVRLNVEWANDNLYDPLDLEELDRTVLKPR